MLRFELERTLMRRRQADDLRLHRFFGDEDTCDCRLTAAIFRKRRPFDHCSPGKCRTCDYVRCLHRLDRRRERLGARRQIGDALADSA